MRECRAGYNGGQMYEYFDLKALKDVRNGIVSGLLSATS